MTEFSFWNNYTIGIFIFAIQWQTWMELNYFEYFLANQFVFSSSLNCILTNADLIKGGASSKTWRPGGVRFFCRHARTNVERLLIEFTCCKTSYIGSRSNVDLTNRLMNTLCSTLNDFYTRFLLLKITFTT